MLSRGYAIHPELAGYGGSSLSDNDTGFAALSSGRFLFLPPKCGIAAFSLIAVGTLAVAGKLDLEIEIILY